jgi:hypothetical protein
MVSWTDIGFIAIAVVIGGLTLLVFGAFVVMLIYGPGGPTDY